MSKLINKVKAKLKIDENFVKAEMENFDFDLVVKVVSFTVSANINGFTQTKDTKGATITADQKNIINRAKAGDKIYFDDIKAYMPDGTTRDLGSISFKVN